MTGASRAGRAARVPDGGDDRVRDAEHDASAMLRRRDRSRADLFDRLAARGHEERSIDAALARLATRGLYDERRAAESRAFVLLARRGFARARAVTTLLAEGFPESLADPAVDAALASVATADRAIAPDATDLARDERARAIELAERAARQLRDRAPDARARAIVGRLARRGFDADTIADGLRHVGLSDALPDDFSI